MRLARDRIHPKDSYVAAVLAGGRGTRLGMDKTLLEIDGRNVLDYIVGCLKDVFASVLVVLPSDRPAPIAAPLPGVEFIHDVLPSNGPLVGIYTALEHSPAPYVFVMACDMPYPNTDLVRFMLRKAGGWEAVVPRSNGHLEPLFAVYRRDLLEKIRAFLDQDRLKIPELIEELDVRYVEEDEIAACDPEFHSFLNINTLQDLKSTEGTYGVLSGSRRRSLCSTTLKEGCRLDAFKKRQPSR